MLLNLHIKNRFKMRYINKFNMRDFLKNQVQYLLLLYNKMKMYAGMSGCMFVRPYPNISKKYPTYINITNSTAMCPQSSMTRFTYSCLALECFFFLLEDSFISSAVCTCYIDQLLKYCSSFINNIIVKLFIRNKYIT